MAATKFTEAEREKLFAQLEAPFNPALIKWRVMRTFDNGRSGVILPFADPRAYTDRLNDLFTPSGWTREYTISIVPSLCRMERGKPIAGTPLAESNFPGEPIGSWDFPNATLLVS